MEQVEVSYVGYITHAEVGTARACAEPKVQCGNADHKVVPS
jgi:hypothetical protein